MKHYLPQSLFGRFLTIILVPAVLAQLVATFMFYYRHWDTVSRHMMRSLSNDMALVVSQEVELQGPAREQFLRKASTILSMDAEILPNLTLLDLPPAPPFEYSVFVEELDRVLPYPFRVQWLPGKDDLVTYVETRDGVLALTAARKRFATPTTYIFILWMVGSTTFLMLVSILFLRNQVRSIKRLAEAAEAFGKGLEVPRFKPTGALEVRRAAEAFLKMRERIKRQIAQRTAMLAGISHDLKTPLTRIKLELALMEPQTSLTDLNADLVDMERMIQAYLEFAKGEEGGSETVSHLSDMLRAVVSRYRYQAELIDLKIGEGLTLHVNEIPFKRALTNILDNALRYATHVVITAFSEAKHVVLWIDDNGPGIPDSKREEVFRPFYRLDSSRNAETGGTGLGLAITQDIITSHGGTIALEESPEGGLRVVIRLPK